MSAPAVLVTGATGFIGRHVVTRLALAGRRIVVLARGRADVSCEERVERIFGHISKVLEILEGDLTHPAGVERNLRRLRSHIDAVIHCAGETSFSMHAGESARTVHIDGPLALLQMLSTRGLCSWGQVSTAFVCGRRTGIIYEHETDVGQAFHNTYERLKLQSEVRFR